MPEYPGLLLISWTLLFTAKATVHQENNVLLNTAIPCDSELTSLVTDKNKDLTGKICLFKTPKSLSDNLECGEDSLRVLMCRRPFLLFEKVNQPKFEVFNIIRSSLDLKIIIH